MKRILLVLLCLISFSGMASHIVGGEFELLHLPNGLDGVERFNYRLNLIYYFDVKNNGFPNPPSVDEPTITCNIYRKSDDKLIRTVTLSFLSQTHVEYTQPECSKSGVIVTDKITYTNDINLPAPDFSDPQGYYVVWERCCRNYQIVNIFSDNNTKPGGIAAGQTFYLSFPPVTVNGVPFTNSSPHLFPPLSDYACPSRPYYANFAGTDDDGDSIVYSVVTPLTTHNTVDAIPPIQPQPYPLITWRPPFSLTNIMGGKPDLKISRTGFLTVTPGGFAGLYVFAIRCEEYRHGKKIGETRRDFQLYVSDSCEEDDAPQVTGRKVGGAAFTAVNQPLSIQFSNTTLDADRCIEIQVYDADALKAKDNFQENITLKAIPINFDKDVSNIAFSGTSVTLTQANSTKIFTVCFDQCPLFEHPYQIGIVAFDDACALPLSDTLIVNVNIEPPANINPEFTTLDVQQTLFENQSATWPIEGIDGNNDPLIVTIVTDGFNMADYGMGINVIQQINGKYDAQLTWDTHCNGYDFSKRTSFNVKIIIEDQDHCNFAHPDTMTFKLNVLAPGADPVIDSDLTSNTQERIVKLTRRIYESLHFTVTGKEADNDFLILGGNGKDFSFSDYGMSFAEVSGNGNIMSPFTWDIACKRVHLDQKDTFDLRFILVDNATKCRIYRADTLDVVVNVLPPFNTRPDLFVASVTGSVPVIDNALSVTLGQQINLALRGVDKDVSPKDSLKLQLINAGGTIEPKGYEFKHVDGMGEAEGSFFWFPDCSIFENNVYKNDYTFSFSVTDNRCVIPMADTVTINVTIKDVEADATAFLPPNFISPNGDAWNNFFAMVKEDEQTHELVNILPKDNCVGRFINVRIYNRWGKEVYKSADRDFRWYADNESTGVYYYFLKYSDKEYKGTITVRL